jgi:hypothetical protein
VRHFRSIFYAVVLAPAVWVLVGVGLTHDLTARGRDGFAAESLTGLMLLLLGGAAYGILVFVPISPLGPFVAGLVFFGVSVWAIEWPAGYAGAWPRGMVKDGFDLSRPGYGLAALLAVPLLLTVLSVRRWSGFEPVVLPIIGPVGRARGAAAVAGTPVAAMQTAVFTVPAVGRPADDGELTTVLRRPEPADVTMVLQPPSDGEETTVLRSPGAGSSPGPASGSGSGEEPPTEDVATGSEEPTDAIADGPPAGESVTAWLATASDEPTDTLSDERPTEDVLDEPLTETIGDEPATEALPTEVLKTENDEPTGAVADERPTDEMLDEPTVSIGSQEEPAEVVAAQPSDEATESADADSEHETSSVMLPADQAVVADEATDVAAAAGEAAGIGKAAGIGEVAEPTGAATIEEVSAPAAVAVAESGSVETAEAAPSESEERPADSDEPATAVLTAVAVADEQSLGGEAIVGEPHVESDEAADEAVAGGSAAVGPVVGDEESASVLVAEGVIPDDVRAIVVDEVADLAEDDEAEDDEAEDDEAEDDEAAAEDDGVVVVEETTYLLVPADDDERTQAIRLSAALADDGERTQVIRPVGYEPGQTTRDLGVPGERTQVIWPAANRVPGERTVVFGGPGEQTRRIVRAGEPIGPDETQVLRLPDPDDGERTQVIRPGRVTPPSRHLEPSPLGEGDEPGRWVDSDLGTPAAEGAEPVRRPGDRTDTGRPPSIAGAESPNFAEDPTGRLFPTTPTPDEPTRTMTVMNMERPPGDIPEIPAQRTPPEDED